MVLVAKYPGPKTPRDHSPMTVREHARNRGPLDGADAQALEGALQLVERDLDGARILLERDRALAVSMLTVVLNGLRQQISTIEALMAELGEGH